MKRMNLRATLPLLLALTLATGGLTACSSDSPEDTEVSAPVSLSSQSIAEGAELTTATTQLELVYSAPVSVANAAGIQLNGTQVEAKASGTRLTVTLNLSEGTDYTFSLAQGALCRYGEPNNPVPGLTIHFKTTATAAATDESLVNPNATQQAQRVYAYLRQQYGQKTLSGVMAEVNNNNNFSTLVYNSLGKHPALTAYDFLHLPYSPANWIDYGDITPARTQWENNGLVSYMWHWNVPSVEGETDPARYGFYAPGGNGGSGETSFDIREALKEGTWQHAFILKDIERVAGYLKQLQDAGIPVLWRPLHEAAGNYGNAGAWFWWGRYGAEYTRQLWQLLYDQLVNKYGLNNLIWVWTVQVKEGHAEDALAAYPGNDMVDIVAADIYAENTDSKRTEFDFVRRVADGRKLVTLSECGNVPNPTSCFESGDTWSWFMVWYGYKDGQLDLSGGSSLMTPAYWQTLANDSHVVWREDMPSLK